MEISYVWRYDNRLKIYFRIFIRKEQIALKFVNCTRPTYVELSDFVGCNYYEADTLYSHHPSGTLLTWPKYIKGCVFV